MDGPPPAAALIRGTLARERDSSRRVEVSQQLERRLPLRHGPRLGQMACTPVASVDLVPLQLDKGEWRVANIAMLSLSKHTAALRQAQGGKCMLFRLESSRHERRGVQLNAPTD